MPRGGVRPVVRHREFSGRHKAWNARQDEAVYGQRAQSETVNSTIKRRFGSRARSRVWYVQFREVTVKAIVHNVGRAIPRSSAGTPSSRSGREPVVP
jgi:IS5 family transposase